MKDLQVNRDAFFALCEQTKLKYVEFEEKIKNVELKLNKKISTEYNLDNERLLKKFIDENLDSGQMHDFIRHECLNLIIERKQFVKDSKERIKTERQQLKGKQSNLSTPNGKPAQEERNNISESGNAVKKEDSDLMIENQPPQV